MNKEIISEYYLERYVLGELPSEDAEKIYRLASTQPEIQNALEEIVSSNRDILSLYPASTVKANLLARVEEVQGRPAEVGWFIKTFSLRRILYISSAVAAALVFFILILPSLKKETGTIPSDLGDDFSLVKGIQSIDLSKTQLLIFRKDKDKVEILKDGMQASTGDLLQLAYVAAKEPYGMILSIDGRRSVTLHFPEEKGASTELMLNKRALLANAIKLDDAPSFERFFLITSGSPVDVDDILKKAENLAKIPERAKQMELDLPDSIKQYSVLILKGERS
jgi:anti-sigma-K factor RskA